MDSLKDTPAAEVEDPGKRMFFRKFDYSTSNSNGSPSTDTDAKRPSVPEIGRWVSVGDNAVVSNDVFWCVWQPPVGQTSDTQLIVGGDEGVLLHQAGDEWRRFQAPDKLPVHSLWGNNESDVYAVGWMGQVLRFDGDTWLPIRGAIRDDRGKWSSDKENTPLFAITGDGTGKLWAVGDHGAIIHFDGTDWVTQTSGTASHLRCVAKDAAGRVFCAGADGVLLVSDSSSGNWQAITSGFNGTIQSLLCTGEDTLLLAGGYYLPSHNRMAGKVARLKLSIDGVRVDTQTYTEIGADPDLPRIRHMSQRTVDGVVIITGDSGYCALMNDETLAALPTNTQHDLLGACYTDEHGLVTVGDFATLMIHGQLEPTPVTAQTQEHSPWVPITLPTRRQLWAIGTDAKGSLCCCGDGGVVMRQQRIGDISHWESMAAPTNLALHCLCTDFNRGFYVAGQMGQIHHYDGKQWKIACDLKIDITILAFYAAGSNNIFAVGDEGLVLHFDGERWDRMSSGTKNALYSAWGLDSEHVLAVGDFGLVLRYNGTDWREFHVGTEHFLFGVEGHALDDITVVGLSGTIGHFNGTQWQLTPARAREDLLDVCRYENTLFAVGVNGLIMRKDNNQWSTEVPPVPYALRAVHVDAQQGLYAVGDQGTLIKRSESNPVHQKTVGTSVRKWHVKTGHKHQMGAILFHAGY